MIKTFCDICEEEVDYYHIIVEFAKEKYVRLEFENLETTKEVNMCKSCLIKALKGE